MFTQFFEVKTHILPTQYIREYPSATLDDQEATLHIHIKQYVPRDRDNLQQNPVTIIAGHANAFAKELYEPFWDELYQRSRKGGFAIRSIWIADIAHQGMSYVLNEDKTGNDPCWKDHARDMLYMINHFRKEMLRPIIGIGHSMGGNQLVNLSLMHPRLLSTLVLIEPIIRIDPQPAGGADWTRASTFRRDIWPSRSIAAASFDKSPFYSDWDPRVRTLWNEFGLRDLPTAIYPSATSSANNSNSNQSDSQSSETPVTLTTPKHQEVFSFLRPNFAPVKVDPDTGRPIFDRSTHPDLDFDLDPETTHPFYRPESTSTFHNLPFLRPSALYIFGGTSEVTPAAWRASAMETTGVGVGGSGGVKEGRVKDVVAEGVGHLVPMIAPAICAEKTGDWLEVEMRRWSEEEERWKRGWLGRTKRERMVVSEEWKRRVGGDPREEKRVKGKL